MTTDNSIHLQIEKVYCRFTKKTDSSTETGICYFSHKKPVGTIWDMYYFKTLGDFNLILEVSETWIGDLYIFEPISLKNLRQEVEQMKIGLENSIIQLSQTIYLLKSEHRKVEVQFFEKTLTRLNFCVERLRTSQELINELQIEESEYVPVK